MHGGGIIRKNWQYEDHVPIQHTKTQTGKGNHKRKMSMHHLYFLNGNLADHFLKDSLQVQ